MTETIGLPSDKKPRLKFIDMARSIAILLMLQGHFIALTYQEYQPMFDALKANGTSGNIFFDLFVKIRGFTAPLFFTITGLVFAYLLTKNSAHTKNVSFFKNERVKKGVKRAFTIILWAYFIQINLKYILYYLRGNLPKEFLAFHILQAISIGILLLLLIFGIHKFIKRGSMILYYFIAGVLIFTFYTFIESMGKGEYFPANAPMIIQNMFHGPKSIFPIFPWIGYVMFGGMLGTMLNKYQEHVSKKWFPYATMGFGILLYFFGICFGKLLDLLNMQSHSSMHLEFEKNAWVYGRLAEVIILLAILMLIERYFKIKESLFLKIGQNTLPIYILHVIILSGAVTGYSIKTFYDAKLSGFESITGAALFILFFVIFIKYIENITDKISKVKRYIFRRPKL